MKVGNLIEISAHGTGIITNIDWCDIDEEAHATIFLVDEARFIFIADDSVDWIED